MIAEADEFMNNDKKSGDLHPHQDDSDDMEIVDVKPNTGYIFNPLTIEQCTTICYHTGLIYRKDELNFSNEGENMGTRSPKVRSIKGDGNCFFRAVSVGLMGWEVGHLKIRQMVCKHITTYGTYTCESEGKYYVNQIKMKVSGTYVTDVEIMAAAQIFGVNIYVYHTYGGTLRWLRFPCKHTSGSVSLKAIYLDNRYGDGKTGHFDFVILMYLM